MEEGFYKWILNPVRLVAVKMFIVYKTTNLVNNKIYIGVHCQEGSDFDGYLGSGTAMSKAINKYSKENFSRETLYSYENDYEAYSKEAELVNLDFVVRKDNYNINEGGFGSFTSARSEVGKSNRLKTLEEKYGSKGGNLKEIHKTLTEKYGSTTAHMRSPEAVNKLVSKYGSITGQLHTKEAKAKSIETRIKKYGSITGHANTPEAIDNMRRTKRSNSLFKYPILQENIVVLKSGEIIFKGSIYDYSILVNGFERAIDKKANILNPLKSGNVIRQGKLKGLIIKY